MVETEEDLNTLIEEVSEPVGKVWPLYSFVTSNPLSGFEDQHFPKAVDRAEDLLGGHGYPTSEQFLQAWEEGRIDADLLLEELVEHDLDLTPTESIEYLESQELEDPKRDRGARERKLDQVLVKWLGVFLDEGRTKWSMPGREKGFYQAWKTLASMDSHLPNQSRLNDLPENKNQAIRSILQRFNRDDWSEIIQYHLTALPGWTGYIKQRQDRGDDPWNDSYPVDLADYLAVRLILADHLGARLQPDEGLRESSQHDHLVRDAWLRAWEKTYRNNLLDELRQVTEETNHDEGNDRPDAQLVFCIDTRSEIIRRHIEETGDYQTFGYAGFFGIPMRYEGYDSKASIDSCPPIVTPEHRITDIPREDRLDKKQSFDNWKDLTSGIYSMMKSLKNNVITAFNYVEGTGGFYGLSLLTRTLFPKIVYRLRDSMERRIPGYDEFTIPDLDGSSESDTEHDHDLPQGMTLEERVQYAESAFRLMGWTETFAPIVVFTGHSSETTNNPFDSSLDCGACAGNPGGPNARVLAEICNQDEVRQELRESGIEIPEDTLFLAGEHNTTTDEIELFTDDLPQRYRDRIQSLKKDLSRAQETSTAERVETLNAGNGSSVEATQTRAVDWAQTRPEWGLAGNASFIIAPRNITRELDLNGRSFLHAYDWKKDPDGEALENIMGGPLVVTQWINNQYYFATVSNGVYGSGSKVTQNPIGNFGVLQGNGSDLMSGLPLQSLKASDLELYHQPIRLSGIIYAPRDFVAEKLNRLDKPRTLVENEWISLSVVDPKDDHNVFQFKNGGWEPKQFDRVSRNTDDTVARTRK